MFCFNLKLKNTVLQFIFQLCNFFLLFYLLTVKKRELFNVSLFLQIFKEFIIIFHPLSSSFWSFSSKVIIHSNFEVFQIQGENFFFHKYIKFFKNLPKSCFIIIWYKGAEWTMNNIFNTLICLIMTIICIYMLDWGKT